MVADDFGIGADQRALPVDAEKILRRVIHQNDGSATIDDEDSVVELLDDRFQPLAFEIDHL